MKLNIEKKNRKYAIGRFAVIHSDVRNVANEKLFEYFFTCAISYVDFLMNETQPVVLLESDFDH